MDQVSVRSAAVGTGKTFLAIVAIFSLLLSMFAVVQPAAASHESDVVRGDYPLDNADRECQEAGFDFGFKLDGLDNADEGIYTYSANGFSGSIQLIDTDDDGEVDDYVILSGPEPTIVKQPNPGGGISHITFCFFLAPEITIEKSGDALSKVGDEVTFTVKITNTGSITAFLSSLNDSLVDLSGVDTSACDELAAGAFCEFSYTYTVDADDLTEGDLVNEVTATYTSQAGGAGGSTTVSDDHLVDIFTPGISVNKEITTEDPHFVGDSVGYKITITNTGSDNSPALVFDAIADTRNADVGLDDCDASLAVGSSCTIEYTLSFEEAGEYCNTVSVETHPDGFPNNVDASDEVCVTVSVEEDLGSITVVKELEECELCETFTRGRYFDGGQFDEEFAQAFPEGITVGEFGPFMTAEDVRNFEHEDPRIEQLLIQYLTLLINIDNCADLLTHELNGTPVSEIRDEALAILTDPEAYSAEEVSAAIDAVTAINESSQNEEGNPLTCDTESTVGADDFTFTLVGPEGEDSQDWGDRTSGQTWEDLPAGTYTLTETGPADVDCVIVSATGTGVVDFDEDSVTIELAEGADVTITIVNDCEGEQPPPPPPPGDETGELEIIKVFCAFEGEDDILTLGPVFEEPVDGFAIASAHEDVLEDGCTLGAPADDEDGATFTVVGETDDGDPVNLTETTTWGEILTLQLEPGDYRVTELGTELFADVRVEADGDTVVIVFNYEEELPEEEDQGRIKIIKLACTGPDGVTFTVVPGDQSSAALPAGATNCAVSDATFVLENSDGDQSASFTVGSDGIRLVPVDAGTYTLIETAPLAGESGDILVTEGETTTVIVFNLTAGEGTQPEEETPGGEGQQPTGEGTLPSAGGPGQGTLPNTATMPEPTGSVPAVLLALAMLTGLGAAGYAMQAEARRRR